MGYDCNVVDSEGNDIPGEGMYFRRNIFGMGPTRQALEDVGMGYWAHKQPELPDGGPDWNDPQHWDEETGGPVSAQAREHQDAITRSLRATGDERPGIPLHKFCSNDGWWVTKIECESALKLWEIAGNPTPEYFGTDLIPFLRAGAAYSGFRVY